ncbi:hypothetical protein [Brucella intermedia]|uniref:hypothetical protein n=1 Tax=Brucella intermedia TaxID=94625 RepID=UPI00124E71F6|nr:hypothetical protein [Brucella intermedia]KAB2720369.1 hypothetical protein F9K75_04675 [Brucella intermedia]
MHKVDAGEDIFAVTGRMTNKTGGGADPNIGDAYEYVLVGDTTIKNVVIPHPLQKYISGNDEVKFYFTRYRKANVLTAIDNGSETKFANESKIGINKATLALLALGALMVYFSVNAGMFPHAEIFFFVALVLAAFVGLVFYNANQMHYLSKKLDKNIPVLKSHLAKS